MTETSGSTPDTPQGQQSGQQSAAGQSPGQQPPPYEQPPPYGQPPPGGQPYGQSVPPQGQPYGQPPPGWAPQPMSQSDERLWSLLSHLSYFVLGIIAPLIIMLTKGKESAYVRHHSVEALNFHITVAIALIVSSILMIVVIGFFTFVAAYIVGIVFTIMASIAANRGEMYRYPINIRFVK